MHEIRLTVFQREALDLQKENLVIAAEALLSEAEVTTIPKNKFGDSQLQNLLAIANETQSPAVVSNFIRYQMGRDRKKLAWARPAPLTGTPLGDLLINAIDRGAVSQAVASIEGLEGQYKQIAKMTMLRHFLGFISRHLKYLEDQRSDRTATYS